MGLFGKSKHNEGKAAKRAEKEAQRTKKALDRELKQKNALLEQAFRAGRITMSEWMAAQRELMQSHGAALFRQQVGIHPSAAPQQATQPGATTAASQHAALKTAARAIFNTTYVNIVDPDDTLWKKNIKKELAVLAKGGTDSVSVLEELFMQCANGQGMAISSEWYNNGVLAVKAAAVLPKKEAAALMVRILKKDSRIAEWFRNIQPEAAVQLGKLGDADILPDLQALLKQPFSMSPIPAITSAIEQLGGNVPQIPSVVLAKAENQLGDMDGLAYLMPMMEQAEAWAAKDQAFYYYLLAHKAKRLGFASAARAFYAAQIAARPDATTFGWQEFMKEGVAVSPENAAALHQKYPVPKTMEEIQAGVTA